MLSLQGQVSFFVRAQRAMVVAMIALAGAFYSFSYRPQTRQQAALKKQIDNVRQELRSAQAQTTMLPNVEADVERLQVRLQKFKSLSKRGEQGQFVKEMSQLSQLAGLKKEPLLISKTLLKGDKVWEDPNELTLEGDFSNVFSFLRHTENLQRLTRVSKMNMKSPDRQGQVKVQLTMSIYYLAE